MTESKTNKHEKPEICKRCRCYDYDCAMSEQLDLNADHCSLFSAPRNVKPTRYMVSWPTGRGQRRFMVHYPNGSFLTGMITTGETL